MAECKAFGTPRNRLTSRTVDQGTKPNARCYALFRHEMVRAGAYSEFVIARHSRSKNGVASLAYDRAIQQPPAPVKRTSADGYWMPRLKRGMTRRGDRYTTTVSRFAARVMPV